MLQIPKNAMENIKNFSLYAEKLKNEEIERKEFKPHASPMGVCNERYGNTCMVRPRISSGFLSFNDLKVLNNIAKKYSHGKLHLTTRQDFQFHQVAIEDTVNVMKELLEAGLITRGTGGNCVRNVTCSPLSGVEKDEIFDVSPYAFAVTEFLMKDNANFSLPRKYKIGFSNTEADEGHAKISDLGFVAVKTSDNKEGFRLYGAGGLGSNPKPSLVLKEFIEKEDVIYHAQAMKLLFEKHGNRENRAVARIRYIVKRLGEEKFREEYNKFYELAKQDSNIDNSEIKIYIEKFDKLKNLTEGTQSVDVDNLNIFAQKNKNKYSIYFQPLNGDVTSEELDKLIEVLENLEYNFSLRLSLNQSFYIRDIDGKDIKKIINASGKMFNPSTIEKSTSCIGANVCLTGICLSQNFEKAIKEIFNSNEKAKKLKNTLPKVSISGCPNSCGQHQLGAIGFYGRVKKVDGNLIPTYTLMFGGSLKNREAILGKEKATFPAKAIPEFLLKLSELKENSAKDLSFDEFLDNQEKEINTLIEKYSMIPSITDKPEYYKDFGQSNFFKLR